MTRAAVILLTIGGGLFVALLAWQGFGSVVSTLMAAGWGLAVVAAFHLLPLVLDAGAISVMLDRRRKEVTELDTVFARWIGESVNSLLPAGQIGGPVMMVRQLSQRGLRMRDAAAAITVSTTLQALAQIVFAMLGLLLFGASAAHGAMHDLQTAALIATGVLAAMIIGFYMAQRRGLFGKALRVMSKVFGKRDWSALTTRADAVDVAVRELYDQRGKVAASFALSLAGWIIGTVEVWLALRFLGHPVGWVDALLLESLGQAIRGAAFAIPGSLGIQEGGYLLLAPLVGLPPEAALALSLVKRARELLLGLPGLLYLHFSERSWQRRRDSRLPAVD
ncbi:flippase-like domain-containing protein [Paraburkholderia hospita]|uniref:flippase-like domain-containing protein n=1 Tax=Paraburkholderia hospita TaxID=169430 RepID=UPI0002718C2C|nr:flippase-like domain-containing protein [Paraburkholderia hospita]EUC18176.1 membrane protein [Burkholderia sp. BT03]SKC87340.1 putative membrane protein [Burkholderia sp. CF099]SOE84739.1 putative membrane protein [Burkholderia sp. YR290]AXF01054.1 TIGR00374 family protein [Paraburkholderia hospita]OUL87617.1 TIGR00374 family protein [Paraburkholderia hospita]